MKKIISSIITSLDGKAAGPNGELNMFKVEEEFFNMSETLTKAADTALYGKGTYSIMQAYWPTAGNEPNASHHDKQHSAWYNKVNKIVLSTTLKSTDAPNATIIGKNYVEELTKLKNGSGKDIQIFGSPGVVSSLTDAGLIDEYWIFIFPVIIGNGLTLFRDIKQLSELKLLESRALKSGAIVAHYSK